MGRLSSTILFSLILLFAAPCVNATITNWSCDDDNDGAIVMNYDSIALKTVGSEYELSMTGAQYRYPAHVLGDFHTDTELDPTVRILEGVTNDTTFAWTDYHIAIGMTKSFSFASTGLAMPDGWTAVIGPVLSGQPLPGDISPGTGWVGIIDYYQSAGDPVAIGDDGLFGFKVTFLGSTDFYTSQVPTPEPTTIALLGLGALSVVRRRRV